MCVCVCVCVLPSTCFFRIQAGTRARHQKGISITDPRAGDLFERILQSSVSQMKSTRHKSDRMIYILDHEALNLAAKAGVSHFLQGVRNLKQRCDAVIRKEKPKDRLNKVQK